MTRASIIPPITPPITHGMTFCPLKYIVQVEKAAPRRSASIMNDLFTVPFIVMACEPE
ncbi:hypothetical protein D3C72_2576060 [compost metagenome]